MTRHYLLPPDQIERVREAGGPLAELPDLSKVRDQTRVAVVEVDGRIVGYWVLWMALHVEPLWVTPDVRRAPAVIKGLLAEVESAILSSGESAAFAVIDPSDVAQVAAYAERLGFHDAPGKLLYIVVTPAVAQEVG
jgi:hypothetical protein